MGRIPEIRIDGLYIEITDRCNLRCSYCCRSCDPRNRNNMAVDFFEEIIKDAVKMGSENIWISGGEALLHPQIEDIVHLVKKYGEDLTVLTNGTVLSGIESSFLHEIESLQISLDGGDREANDAMRGIGTFDRIQEGIENVIRKGYPSKRISLKMVITNKNYHQVKQLAYFANQYNIQSIGYSFVYKEGRANEIEENVFLDDGQKIKVMEMLDELNEIFPEMFIASPGYTEICPLLKEEIKLIPRIDVLGNVYACQMFDLEYSLGNLHNHSLEDIMHGSKTNSLRQLLVHRKDFMKKCHSCFIKGRCGRGCPGIALHRDDLFETDDMCCLRKKYITDYLKYSLNH